MLNDVTLLVTGARQGIGRATVSAALAHGAKVIAVDRNAESLAEVWAGHPDVTCRAGDITHVGPMEALFAEVGAVDALVNCAGYVANGRLTDCSPQDLQISLDVNVTGTALMSRLAVEASLAAKRPLSIVNVASVISSERAAKGRFAYGTTKAAVIGMTKSIAFDYIRDGIRCNAVCPGTVDTPSLRERVSAISGDFGGMEEAMKAFDNRQPIGRMGTAEEIAETICFLASSRTPFMTGSIILADGGFAL